MKLFLIAMTCFASTLFAHATIKLPNLIGNNMVMQQNTKVKVWGLATPLHALTIKPSWSSKQYQVSTDSKGNWDATIATANAGGPFTISFKDEEEELVISNVLLGEVWVCSGQSNMVMPLKGYDKGQNVLNGDQLISSSGNYKNIRVFDVPKLIATTPAQDCMGSWKESNPHNASNFSALAFQYAIILQEKLQVPIGIITTCWGSTAIQSWMSKENLNQFPEVTISTKLDTMKVPAKDPEALTAGLFNGMISPIGRYGIKGFIWYQGESNKNAQLYQKLLPAMVKEWRKLWNADLPFYYIQIAPYNYKDRNTAFLREAQLRAKIPNAGMVVTIDAAQQNRIHPADKTILAQRLSNIALSKTYKIKNIAYKYPELQKVKFNAGVAILSFKNVYAGLKSTTDTITGFEMAGPDKVFYPALAAITKTNELQVACPKVPRPIAVRYAFKNWVEAELYNSENLPASSFRTDRL